MTVAIHFALRAAFSRVSLTDILGTDTPANLLSAETPGPSRVVVKTTGSHATVYIVGWSIADISDTTRQNIANAVTSSNSAEYLDHEEVPDSEVPG